MFLIVACLSGCQSGCTSRYTGGTTKLKCPEDAYQIINMSKSESNKYLFYRTKEGKLMLKEYSDVGVFEATYELSDIKVDDDLKRK